MTELTPETRDALAPQLRAVSDTLDEWLMRAHGILSSWQHPDWFLEWLEKRGWTVADKARIEALEKNTIKAQFKTMDELGAGHMAMILGKENGEAVKAAVFLTGKGTQEILDGIERIYDRQDAALCGD